MPRFTSMNNQESLQSLQLLRFSRDLQGTLLEAQRLGGTAQIHTLGKHGVLFAGHKSLIFVDV